MINYTCFAPAKIIQIPRDRKRLLEYSTDSFGNLISHSPGDYLAIDAQERLIHIFRYLNRGWKLRAPGMGWSLIKDEALIEQLNKLLEGI